MNNRNFSETERNYICCKCHRDIDFDTLAYFGPDPDNPKTAPNSNPFAVMVSICDSCYEPLGPKL